LARTADPQHNHHFIYHSFCTRWLFLLPSSRLAFSLTHSPDWSEEMSSTSPEAATVHVLLRQVLRGFYSVRQIIAYDILLKHSSLRDIHLAQLMNITTKDLHKLVAPLQQDRLLQQHTKAEPKTPAELERQKLGVPEFDRKPRQRVFYFVDYRTAVDAIKWRILQLTSKLTKENAADVGGYVCPRCGRRYSTFDAAALLSADGMNFICLDCGSLVQEEKDTNTNENGKEKAKYTRLLSQIDPIVQAMKAVDTIHVPENTFAIALANAIPPFEDAESSADYPSLALNHSSLSKSDLTTTAAAGLTFQIDFSNAQDGPTADEVAKRTAQQAQNALPVWHTESTISGELTHAGARQIDVQPEYRPSLSGLQDEDEKTKKQIKMGDMDAGNQDEIAAYYAAARKNARDNAAADADFSEDDGQWEDSGIGGEATPGVSSNISTPGSEQGPSAPAAAASEGTTGKDDDDDDEDEEFEDV
jgi:transcription initiation factor TFIIE subunit alpha